MPGDIDSMAWDGAVETIKPNTPAFTCSLLEPGPLTFGCQSEQRCLCVCDTVCVLNLDFQ